MLTRRSFLNRISVSAIAIPWLLQRQGLLAADPVKPDLDAVYDLKPKSPHFHGRAKAMIDLFQFGGPSQMDLFDPKPLLAEKDGGKFPGKLDTDNAAGASGTIFGSKWKFQKHGQCGMEISELLPHIAGIADEICLIRGMRFGTNAHDRGAYLAHTCGPTPGRPTLGSWINYALGTENDGLPCYVALTAKDGLPLYNQENWSAGWLPGIYQGTQVRPEEPRILNLDPPVHLAGRSQESQLAMLKKLNDAHFHSNPAERDLEARIASYQLAAKMQVTAKEAFDISNEPDYIKKMYGLDDPNPSTADYAARCIIARRLVERGVRFIQVLNAGNGDVDWDSHGSIGKNLPKACAAVDKPSAALILDLKQRGLLDTTLVRWGGEMGRLPTAEAAGGRDSWGRDHNGKAGCMWLAGAGMKPGLIHGATDEWGHEAVDGIVSAPDFHATVLHLFGIEHTKLTYKRNGLATTLTDGQPAKVLKELFV
jgi:Protein of unknown function (DUF1501)